MVAIGFIEKQFGTGITWLDWFIAGAPFSTLLSVAVYFIMTRMMKPEMKEIAGGQATIKAQLGAIGTTTLREWKLLAIVLTLLGFWATEKVLHNFDTSSTTIAAIALMLLPRIGVMDWKESQKGFPWGTVVLFAVGISVGTALLRTNAAAWLANLIVQNLGLQQAGAFVILMLLSLFLIIIHLGFASATALASTMIPIIISVLLAVQTPSINVVGMTMLLQFVVSFGFILPVNAPQNMIAYGTDTFDARDFVRTGLVITLAATALQKEVSRIGRMLGIAVIIISLVVVGTILLISEIRNAGDVIEVLLLGVALAVAAVPGGLPAILSVVLAMGVQRMAKHKAIVKNLSSVETLGSASVICTDKTGTLTRSEMTIERIMTASGETRITGVGYTPAGRVEHRGAALGAGALRNEQIVVLSGGALAGNAELRQNPDGAWEIHGDPTEAAFLVAERKLGLTGRRERRFERVGEIPFTSERKLMSSIERDHERGDALVVVTKGAPDVLLGRCNRARVGMDVIALDDVLRAKILADVDTLPDAALRTLAVAYRPLDAGESQTNAETLESNLVFVGTVGMMDPPREEAAMAIAEARRAGIRVIMITGDHPRTAARIAADLGIADFATGVLTGNQIDAMDDAAFAKSVRQTSVYARVSPTHKLRIVDALQLDGNIVAMTGDGVNDAPALKSADIGVAMGITGTEVTKEAAKMILAEDNFATIVEAVREGRNIVDNIRKFLRYLLSSNMGEVLTVFLGVVGASVIGLSSDTGAVVLPLLATQILRLNLITDSWPALAMGMDPVTEDVMARKPRLLTERVIDARMWRGILEIGLVVALSALLTMDMYLPGGLIEGQSDLPTARTAGFTVLVFAHLFNCFNARSETTSAFHQLFANPWLWGALALSAALQVAVVHVPLLNIAFGTTPLSLYQWMVCVAMGSTVLWYSELRKLVFRRLSRSDSAMMTS